MNPQQQHALYKAQDEQQYAERTYRTTITQHGPGSTQYQVALWNLESTTATLTKLLDRHGYQPRGGEVRGHYEPDAYAVHPDYLTAFDDGFYSATYCWW